MKKLMWLFSICIVATLTGCGADDANLAEDIVGKWRFESVDGRSPLSIPTPVVSHSQYATASGTRQVVKRLPYKHKELRCIDGVYRLVTVSEGYTSKVVEESYSYTYEVEHEHPIWDRISQTAEAVGEILDCIPWPW